MNIPAESSLTFNVVWTKTTFTYLQYFVASQLAHTTARYRFVANGCPPEQIAAMNRFQARHRDQVVEVMDVSSERMLPHGAALDLVLDQRDDGDHFCLIDPDIKANAPFIAEFAELLVNHEVVTSGTEVWSDDNVIPEGQVGVAGEYFFDRDGFVFGSPHLGLYRRAALDETRSHWAVGFGSNGQDLRDDTLARLAEQGHRYIAYDTSKIVNALLQADGNRLVHRDLPQLVHIGGLAHYLSPPGYITNDDGKRAPNWTRHSNMAARHEVTRYTARTLRAIVDGKPAPAIPRNLEPAMVERLEMVRAEVVDLLDRYGPTAGGSQPTPDPA